MAPSSLSQSVVTGSTMVTLPLPSGLTVIRHPMLLFGSFWSRCAFRMVPADTSKAWNLRVWKLKSDLGSSLNAISNTISSVEPLWVAGGAAVMLTFRSGGATAPVAALVSDSSLSAPSLKLTRTLIVLPTSSSDTT